MTCGGVLCKQTLQWPGGHGGDCAVACHTCVRGMWTCERLCFKTHISAKNLGVLEREFWEDQEPVQSEQGGQGVCFCLSWFRCIPEKWKLQLYLPNSNQEIINKHWLQSTETLGASDKNKSTAPLERNFHCLELVYSGGKKLWPYQIYWFSTNS